MKLSSIYSYKTSDCYYFYCKQERYTTCEFDRIFNQAEGYNQYTHRCDREHAKSQGLTVNNEVENKTNPP